MLFHFEAASSSTKWLPRIKEEARKAKTEGIFGLHLTFYMACTDAKHEEFFNLIIHENIDENLSSTSNSRDEAHTGCLSLAPSRSLM